MSQVVWKYAMPNPGFWRIHEIPEGARVVKSSTANNILHVWMLVDPSKPRVKRHFYVVATGQEFDDTFVYLATVFQGRLVWHIAEDVSAQGSDRIEGRDYG